MPDSIVGLLEKADLAVGAAAGLADESAIAPVAVAAAMLRRRLDYPEDLLIVGLAGGTGSGKSSLVNAITGSETAVVGGMRPTTDRPLAVANPRVSERIEGYLTTLGIDDNSVAQMPDWLCLIDLPDTDSVELGNRLQVEYLVPRLDVIVWVVDPEKYRDSSLHRGYLEPLHEHAHRFVFVLNQVDRLSTENRTTVQADFHQALVDDGIESPTVLATAAGPPAGPPAGIEDLLENLRSRVTSGVIVKALDDLEDAASALVVALGPSGVDFEARVADVAEGAARSITRNRDLEATDQLVAFLETLAGEIGAVTGERMRSAVTRVPGQIRRIVEDLAREPSPVDSGGRSAGAPDAVMAEAARAAIFDRVVGPIRETLIERASALAMATDLSVSTAAARSRMGV